MHTNKEFNLLAYQVIKGSPLYVIAHQEARSRIVMKIGVPPLMINRLDFKVP